MPFVLPPPPSGILTFNATGRFAIWRHMGFQQRGSLLGVAEARAPTEVGGIAAGPMEERWAVLGRFDQDTNDVGAIPKGMAPRWGSSISGSRLYVDGVESPAESPYPAEFGFDDGTWSKTTEAFLGLARGWIEKYGQVGIEVADLLLFEGTTRLELIEEAPDDDEFKPGGVPSMRIFDFEKAGSSPDLGWLYQEAPVVEAGVITRMVFHQLMHPAVLLPIRGALTKCSRDAENGDLSLDGLIRKALKRPEMLADGKLAWYRTEVTVRWGSGEPVKP